MHYTFIQRVLANKRRTKARVSQDKNVTSAGQKQTAPIQPPCERYDQGERFEAIDHAGGVHEMRGGGENSRIKAAGDVTVK